MTRRQWRGLELEFGDELSDVEGIRSWREAPMLMQHILAPLRAAAATGTAQKCVHLPGWPPAVDATWAPRLAHHLLCTTCYRVLVDLFLGLVKNGDQPLGCDACGAIRLDVDLFAGVHERLQIVAWFCPSCVDHPPRDAA